jgi:nitrate reductase / nitrite oxidoreductase, beta subunit
VLVDQDKCRGWRFCVSGCPYKKVYFNHLSGKAEKCIFCYPVTENGRPTVCSETCVGRIRAIGVVLYDLDAVTAAAQTTRATDLVEAQRELLLDPHDARVAAAAEQAGLSYDWIEAARRSPVYALAKELRVALPLHPEFRTLPMVWYVPPLSPVLDTLRAAGYDAQDPDEVFPTVGDLRVPQRYVANVLAAGDPAPVEESLRRLLAMRIVKRRQQLGETAPAAAASEAGMSLEQVERLFRLLALAPYDERYVIPKARREEAGARQRQHGDGVVDAQGRKR